MGEGVVAVQARHLQGSRGKSHLLSWLRSPQMRRGGGGGGSCGPSAGASEGRTLRLSALVSDAWPPSPAQPYSRPWHGWPWYTFLPGVRPSPRIPRQASADSGPALLDLTVERWSQGTPGSLQLAPGPRGTVEGHTTPLLPPAQNSCISQGHSPLESLLSSGLPPCCSSLPAPGVWGLGSGLAHTEA